MNILLSHILLIRPLNVIMSGFSIFIASEIIGPDLDKRLVLLLSVIVMLFTSGANALNDALDLKIDLIL